MKVFWTDTAVAHLDSIYAHLSLDSSEYALRMVDMLNTSPQLAQLEPVDEDEGPFHSLLIMFAGDCWMELIFRQVSVEPREPLAFKLMEDDPNYVMPYWVEEEKTGEDNE